MGLTPLALDAGDKRAPALDSTGTLLVYSLDTTTSTALDLYLARWNGTTFASEGRIDALARNGTQIDPGFDADDTTLYFHDDAVLKASTVSSGPSFASPQPPLDLAGLATDLIRPQFSADGTIVVYWRPDYTMGYGTRPSGGTWALHDELVAQLNDEPGDLRHPTISGDALTVVFSNQNDELRIATRASRDAAFGASSMIPLGNDVYEPALSHDGTKLVFVHDGAASSELSMVSRTCND